MVEKTKEKNTKKIQKKSRSTVFVALFVLITIFGAIWYFLIREEKTKEVLSVEEKIDYVVSSFDAENDASFNAVEKLVDLGTNAIDFLLEELKKDNSHSKWAAIYALSRIGYYEEQEIKDKIIKELKKEFNNKDLTLKIMAAGVAFIFGEKEGAPFLIEGLKYNIPLALTKPSELICKYSYDTLTYYTKVKIGYTCNWNNIDETSYDEWIEWWEENKDKMKWDNKSRKYEIN